MTQKKVNQNIKILFVWFKDDINAFCKIYHRYAEIFQKKFANDSEFKFANLLNIWANLSKTNYLHQLTINEKIDKLETQAMQFF